IYTVVRSLQNRAGDQFVGLENYRTMFRSSATRTAIKNNAIWVVFAPTIVTAIGLMLAVLTERIRWSTAFKFVLFMPMAISLLAAGVLFRLVYEWTRDAALENAAIGGVADVFHPRGDSRGARSPQPQVWAARGRASKPPQPSRPGAAAPLP